MAGMATLTKQLSQTSLAVLAEQSLAEQSLAVQEQTIVTLPNICTKSARCQSRWVTGKKISSRDTCCECGTRLRGAIKCNLCGTQTRYRKCSYEECL